MIRVPENRRSSVRKFNNGARKSRRINTVMRGGFRL